jgi:ribosomal protein L35AE/L33A
VRAKPADKKKKTGLLGGRLINGVLEREHGERGGARPRRRRELAEKLAEVLEGAQSDTD